MHKNSAHRAGFTLMELLVVIAIIAVLAAVVIVSLTAAREKAYYGMAMTEFRSMQTALQIYLSNNNDQYPPDVTRDVPAGFAQYLAGYSATTWPKGPWPGSYFDWENWDDPDRPGQKIYQISIRFCPTGGTLADCRFPKATWASNFGIDSAVYYCIAGYCRAHQSEPIYLSRSLRKLLKYPYGRRQKKSWCGFRRHSRKEWQEVIENYEKGEFYIKR